jgi:hypothetical protein
MLREPVWEGRDFSRAVYVQVLKGHDFKSCRQSSNDKWTSAPEGLCPLEHSKPRGSRGGITNRYRTGWDATAMANSPDTAADTPGSATSTRLIVHGEEANWNFSSASQSVNITSIIAGSIGRRNPQSNAKVSRYRNDRAGIMAERGPVWLWQPAREIAIFRRRAHAWNAVCQSLGDNTILLFTWYSLYLE